MTQTTPSPNAGPQPALPETPQRPQPETPQDPQPVRVKRMGFLKGQVPEQAAGPSREGPAVASPEAPEAPPASSDKPPKSKSAQSGSSPASSLVDTTQLSEGIENGVLALTGQLHELLARDAYDEFAGVYLADSQDAKGIARPAANLIGRRAGDVTGGNPDMADGLAMAIATTVYVIKQLGRFLTAKRARRAGADIPVVQENRPSTPEPA